MPGSINGWPFLIKRSINNKLNVFILEVDTILKYRDWQVILEKRLYHRYEYSEIDLNKSKWVIVYP